jgi:hypothetical protein
MSVYCSRHQTAPSYQCPKMKQLFAIFCAHVMLTPITTMCAPHHVILTPITTLCAPHHVTLTPHYNAVCPTSVALNTLTADSHLPVASLLFNDILHRQVLTASAAGGMVGLLTGKMKEAVGEEAASATATATATALCVGRDSSVDIATCYWLDGPGVESRWERDSLHPSRLKLTLSQHPAQWVPNLSRE